MAFIATALSRLAIRQNPTGKDRPTPSMGLSLVGGAITGLVRTTTSTPARRDHLRAKGRVSFAEEEDGDYATNIQVADLNALNAALAVVRWKKTFGFSTRNWAVAVRRSFVR